MSEIPKIFAQPWADYELLDAGGGKKLERWGKIITIRPEVQAYFHSGLPFTEWRNMAHWEFVEGKGQQGKWKCLKKDAPSEWSIKYKRLQFSLSLTKFKHIGLFPEQEANWRFIEENIASDDKFLNLFAYTGAASCVARLKGAETYHVDSAKSTLNWAKKNMEECKMMNIKWVHDDALKFAAREVKRGHRYKGIIMDPPAWGIGANGEKWKLEDKIDELMMAAASLLDENGFIIMNTYSPTVDSDFLTELISIYFPDKTSSMSQLYMDSKTDKHMYFGELVRIQ
jgi:23S rRNA (cytosine1962-C5)-methyltransferase